MNKRLTDEELEEIRDRVDNATKGPWITTMGGVSSRHAESYNYSGKNTREICALSDGEYIVNMNEENDAAFIAHARQDIPKLLAEIDRLNRLYCELKEIAHNIEVDRNETAAEYREYYEKSEAEIDRLKEMLTEYIQNAEEIWID